MFLDDDDKIIREKLIEFLKKYKIDIDEDKFHLETDDEYIEINCSGKVFVGMNNVVRGIRSDFSDDIDGYKWLYPSHKEKALLLPTNKDEEDMFMDIDNTKEIINSIKSKDYSTSFFVTKIRDREELKNKLVKLKEEIYALKTMNCLAIGNIELNLGILKKSSNKKAKDPPAWHVNFWKIAQTSNANATFENIRNNFTEII